MTALHLLMAIAAIIATTRVVGYLFQRIQQPAVIGELVGGILLGPSLLGWMAPDIFAVLFQPSVVPLLRIHAQGGIILFMFLVGFSSTSRRFGKGAARRSPSRTRAWCCRSPSATCSHTCSIRGSAPPDVRFTPFALFLGVSMSVTAFPVLARILRDRGIHRTGIGAVALACAAVNDVTAWGLLALVVSISEFGTWQAAITNIPGVLISQLNHYAIFASFLLGALMRPGRGWEPPCTTASPGS